MSDLIRLHRARGAAAFTLIELLVVVAILAILAALAVDNYLAAQIRSKTARVRAELRTVATALESYAVAHGKYPPMLGPNDGTGQPGHETNGYGSPRAFGFRCLPPQLTTPVAYITSLPEDPFKGGALHNVAPDAGKPYASGNSLDMGYIYHSIQQFIEAGNPDFDGADLDDYGYWRIYSIGPDRLINPIGTADPTKGWYYDATNGLVSTGEVIRTHKDTTGEHFTRGAP